MSKIKNAFMSLMLDKKGRDALQNSSQTAALRRSGTTTLVDPQAPRVSVKERLDAKIDEVQNRADDDAPQDRKQLIQNAKRVHAAKQEVLADLSEEQRLKLQVLAMKAMSPKSPD